MVSSSFSKVLALGWVACILASPAAMQDTQDPSLEMDDTCSEADETCALQKTISAHEELSDESGRTCKNTQGTKFLCASSSKCCGDGCQAEGGVCCKNYAGYKFSCGAGGSCCGNACMTKDSKCCNSKKVWWGHKVGYQYPVAKETNCEDIKLSKKCKNTKGVEFVCAFDSSCCGDICVAKGGKCCKNTQNHAFACAEDNHCCGNACMDDNSKCCQGSKGGKGAYKFPLTKATAEAPGIKCSSR